MNYWWLVFDALLVAAGYVACWFTKDFVRSAYTTVDAEVEYLKAKLHKLTGE